MSLIDLVFRILSQLSITSSLSLTCIKEKHKKTYLIELLAFSSTFSSLNHHSIHLIEYDQLI